MVSSSNFKNIRKWGAIKGFMDQLMYTKSIYYDVKKLVVEIESEKDRDTIRIEFNEGIISFRTTEQLYLESFRNSYNNVNWLQTFFIFDKPNENDFLLEGGKLKKMTPYTPDKEVVHYAVYTYDIFFEFFSFEVPKVTMFSSLD